MTTTKIDTIPITAPSRNYMPTEDDLTRLGNKFGRKILVFTQKIVVGVFLAVEVGRSLIWQDLPQKLGRRA